MLRVRGIALAELIVTFAAGIAILELLTWMGFYGIRYSLPLFVRGGIEIAGVGIDYQRLVVLAAVGAISSPSITVLAARTGLPIKRRAAQLAHYVSSIDPLLPLVVFSVAVGYLRYGSGSLLTAVEWTAVSVLLGLVLPTQHRLDRMREGIESRDHDLGRLNDHVAEQSTLMEQMDIEHQKQLERLALRQYLAVLLARLRQLQGELVRVVVPHVEDTAAPGLLLAVAACHL